MSATPKSAIAAAPAGEHRSRGPGTLLPLFLILMLLVSAIAVVQVKQHNRELTHQREQLRTEREQLDLEWSQLQLEQATLAQQGRVEQMARGQLGMVEPPDYAVVQVPK